ncbi:histidine kinase [bacterium SCSIO 12696]|nr:histidine kinase [bacterium SCSIO 12696]
MLLHSVFDRIWDFSITLRIVISLMAVLVIALVWTAFRIASFIWMTDESNVWADFGGWFFGAIFIFLCWSTLYHGVRYFYLLDSEHRMKVKAEAMVGAEQIKRLHAESVAKESQLQMLRYQLNPHFLFNTLNAASSLVQLKKLDQANGVIVKLSRFLRYSLDNNPDMKIPLSREIDALMLYLDIEKTRFEERLQLNFDVSESAKRALIPSLLFQPLIENSVKYAIAKNPDGGTIHFSANKIGERLHMSLSDTGSNQEVLGSRGQRSSGRGIGLRNTLDRLKVAYGDDYSFDLASGSEGGLKTTIEIPFEDSGEDFS